MSKSILFLAFWILLLLSCSEQKKSTSGDESKNDSNWNEKGLEKRAKQNLDSSLWDKELFQQDIESYAKYKEIFSGYPLNKSPFPVAQYDYAVSSIPFSIEMDAAFFKGVRIGEYENSESEKVIDKLTLLILTNDKDAEENTLVESRNYPYLTAQGMFKFSKSEYDWVFSASPDGYATLLINMKLFDLRFGETILIYPQKDHSFLYDQIKDSPNKYSDFEDFVKMIKQHLRVKKQLL